MLFFTSGSTGLPKGVMVSEGNLDAGSRIVADYLGLGARDVLAAVLPLAFDYGFSQVTTGLLRGAAVYLDDYLLPADLKRPLLRQKATILAGTPGLLIPLARQSWLPEVPALRAVTNSGGSLPVTTIRRLRAARPETELFLMYGLTEGFRATYLPPEEVGRHPDSIGYALPQPPSAWWMRREDSSDRGGPASSCREDHWSPWATSTTPKPVALAFARRLPVGPTPMTCGWSLVATACTWMPKDACFSPGDWMNRSRLPAFASAPRRSRRWPWAPRAWKKPWPWVSPTRPAAITDWCCTWPRRRWTSRGSGITCAFTWPATSSQQRSTRMPPCPARTMANSTGSPSRRPDLMTPPDTQTDATGRQVLAQTLGPLADCWGSEQALSIDGQPLSARIPQTPAFLYNRRCLDQAVAHLRDHLPDGLGIHYAIKANPFAPLVRHMAGLVDGFDCASLAEMQLAQGVAHPDQHLSIAGPAKSRAEHRFAIEQGITINAESTGEIERIASVSQTMGRQARVALRVNPPFALKGSGMHMGAAPAPSVSTARQSPPCSSDATSSPRPASTWSAYTCSPARKASSAMPSARRWMPGWTCSRSGSRPRDSPPAS